MNTFAINRSLLAPMPILNEALARQRALTIWALVLLVAMVPTALALMLAVQISRYGRKDMDPA
jgi:hypothetical protein